MSSQTTNTKGRPRLQGRPIDISEINLNDVLLGRGASLVRFEGNIRFRQMVQDRMPRYTTSTRRKVKDEVAREVVAAVKARNGRFLRKLVSWVERSELSVPEGADCWFPVDDTVALEKVKQAFRDNRGLHTSSPPSTVPNPSSETLPTLTSNPSLQFNSTLGSIASSAPAMDPLRNRLATLQALQAQQADQNRFAAAFGLLGGTGELMNPSSRNATESAANNSQGLDQSTAASNNLSRQTATSEADFIASHLRMQQLQNALGGGAMAGTNDLLLALARERMQGGNAAALGMLGTGPRTNPWGVDPTASLLGRTGFGASALSGTSPLGIGGGNLPDVVLQQMAANSAGQPLGGQSNMQSLFNLRQQLSSVGQSVAFSAMPAPAASAKKEPEDSDSPPAEVPDRKIAAEKEGTGDSESTSEPKADEKGKHDEAKGSKRSRDSETTSSSKKKKFAMSA